MFSFLVKLKYFHYLASKYIIAQPPGHPEIIKKSLERGSVKGGDEMFIIGRNFRKGIKVIFQDPENADGLFLL